MNNNNKNNNNNKMNNQKPVSAHPDPTTPNQSNGVNDEKRTKQHQYLHIQIQSCQMFNKV